MNNTDGSIGSQPIIRYGYVENAIGMVKDCQSGLSSRMLFCVVSHVVGTLAAVVTPLLIVIGTVGNSIVAHVMLQRVRPVTRQNLYLGCIAIVDTISIVIQGTFNEILNKGLPWLTGGKLAFISYNVSDFGCKISRFALNFLHALTCLWMLVLVTDRVLVVHRPLAMRRFGKRWAAGSLLTALIVAFLISLPNGFLVGQLYVEIPGNIRLIYCYRLVEARTFMSVYTMALSSPPTLFIMVMLLLDLMLMKKVAAAMKARQKLTAGQSSGAGAADRNGTMIVLILVIVYLVLHAPLLALRTTMDVLLGTIDLAANIDYLSFLASAQYTSLVVALVNQCVSFFVLFSRSASFKRSTLDICCCCSSGLRRRLLQRSVASEYKSETRLELQSNANALNAAASEAASAAAAVV